MENLIKQWWDKRIILIWLGLAAVHGWAAVIQHHQIASLISLIIVGLAVIVLTWRALPLGLALAFLEIFVGGHGHLIEAGLFGFSVSLRMTIFAAVLLGWLLLLVARRVTPQFNRIRDWPIALLGAAVILGTAKGLLTNDPSQAFDDMNGYLTLLYLLPIASVTWRNNEKRLLLLTLMTAGTWVAMTTLTLFFAFTHLPGKALFSLYTFVRDARLAEITLLNGDFFSRLLGATPWYFRVFQQSQAVVLALGLVFAASVYNATSLSRRETFFASGLLALLIAGFAAGQSRSLIIGAVAGLVALSLGALLTVRKAGQVLRVKAIGITAIAIALGGLLALAIFPLPSRPDLSEAAFYKKDAGDNRELAVSSRWSLLGPMMDEILATPIIGAGFGESVTFISDDPRLRAINPSGEVTTYRFEWGYQDIWLKMGIFGLLAFFWYFLTMGAMTFEVWRDDRQAWAVIGWFSALTALFAANVFTPYLNHPIGLGLMLAALPFYNWPKPKTQAVDVGRAATQRPAGAYQPSTATQELPTP